MGRYRFVWYASAGSPLWQAASAPWEVQGPADACGVCGGDGASCRGCDGVANRRAACEERGGGGWARYVRR